MRTKLLIADLALAQTSLRLKRRFSPSAVAASSVCFIPILRTPEHACVAVAQIECFSCGTLLRIGSERWQRLDEQQGLVYGLCLGFGLGLDGNSLNQDQNMMPATTIELWSMCGVHAVLSAQCCQRRRSGRRCARPA